MSQSLMALQLAAVGLLLVFMAILLLWAGIAWLARATAPRPKPVPVLEPEDEERRRVAAAATALGCLHARLRREFPLPPTALVSAWQAVRRAQQLNQRGPVR